MKKCKYCNREVTTTHYCTTKNEDISINDMDSLILISTLSSSYMDNDDNSSSNNDSSSYDSSCSSFD